MHGHERVRRHGWGRFVVEHFVAAGRVCAVYYAPQRRATLFVRRRQDDARGVGRGCGTICPRISYFGGAGTLLLGVWRGARVVYWIGTLHFAGCARDRMNTGMKIILL